MNPKKEELNNWQIAEIVYTMRLLIDKLERRDCTDSDLEVIHMAYRSIRNTPDEINEIVSKLEHEWNQDE